MTSGSRFEFNMVPYLDSVQFLPLKDKNVWSSVQAFGTCLRWEKSLSFP
jgi:hypothetical protein